MPSLVKLRVAPVLVAAVLVAGCGASGGKDDSATTTTRSGGATPTTTTSAGDVSEVVHRAVGDSLDQSSLSFEIDALVSGLGQRQAVSYDGKVDQEAGKGEARFKADKGSLTARVIGPSTYLTTDLPAWSRSLDGKTWLHVQKGDLPGVGTLADIDTGRIILYRLLNASDVEAKGTDEVGGTTVHTYAFHLDPEVSDEVPSERKAGVEALLRATGSGVLTIAGTVGVGVDDGLVHAVLLDGGVRAPSDDESDDPRFQIRYEATLGDFGEDVEIERPASSETVDASKASAALALVRSLQSN